MRYIYIFTKYIHRKCNFIIKQLFYVRANLSNDYFTNRQDRYFVIEDCEELCDFYNKLIEKVMEFSFLLQPDGNTNLNPAANYHPYKGSGRIFTQEAASKIQTFLQNEIKKNADLDKSISTIFLFYIILFKTKIFKNISST